jgi:hypothetical protein
MNHRHAVDQRACSPFAEIPFGGVKDTGKTANGGPEASASYLYVHSVPVFNI